MEGTRFGTNSVFEDANNDAQAEMVRIKRQQYRDMISDIENRIASM
jgi:hypothetical protein